MRIHRQAGHSCLDEVVSGVTITFTVPARLKRTGMETRLLIDCPDVPRGASRPLCWQ
jgi:hypothetical protein